MTLAETLSAVLDRVLKDETTPDGCFRRMVDTSVKFVMTTMNVFEDEVAVFLPTAEDAFRFVAPVSLYEDGSSFPMDGSLTNKVFAEQSTLICNDVKRRKPLSIYERAKTSDRHPRPIQKMLAVPLVDGTTTIGVLQVSRRGLTVGESGPDFAADDADKLAEIARAIAPYIAANRPAS